MGTSWLYVPEFHRWTRRSVFLLEFGPVLYQGCYWCSLATGASPCCGFCCWRGWKDASQCWIDVQDLTKSESVQVQTWFQVEQLHNSEVFHEARQR